ncbi:MAG: hypothetical protein R3F07_00910 [Opitutaceae bacterium]
MRIPRFCCFLASLSLFLLLAVILKAEGPAEPPVEKARQFDFWIGEWEVTANGKVAGHNRIESIVGGRALRETWTGTGGYNGTSTNIHDSTTDTWKQFWVDNSGLVLLLEGGLVDGKMVLEGRRLDAEGATVVDRITWTPNDDGSVRQLWESSSNGGQTWTVAFDGLYVKAEGGSAKSGIE